MKDYLKAYLTARKPCGVFTDTEREKVSKGSKGTDILEEGQKQEVSKGTKEAFDTFEPCSGVEYPEIESLQDRLHYALEPSSIIDETSIEPCLAGCGWPVKFYFREGTGYGYCSQCDVHQRIETKIT